MLPQRSSGIARADRRVCVGAALIALLTASEAERQGLSVDAPPTPELESRVAAWVDQVEGLPQARLLRVALRHGEVVTHWRRALAVVLRVGVPRAASLVALELPGACRAASAPALHM